MYKRTEKGVFAQVTSVKQSTAPVYDAIPGIKYTVEYLSTENAEYADKANLRGSNNNPWEYRNSFETDSLGLFVREIYIRMLDQNTADFWPYIETETADVCAEIPSTLMSTLRQLIDADINGKLNSMRETISAMETELKNYQSFIDKYNAVDAYRKFKEEGK